jgi:hypothetical protein
LTSSYRGFGRAAAVEYDPGKSLPAGESLLRLGLLKESAKKAA